MLSRKQFEFLAQMAVPQQKGKQHPKAGQNSDQVAGQLETLGYVRSGLITHKGMMALEHYRARRAIFIAAGLGSRLAPITINTPKPLIRIEGVRIIDRLIDACLQAGIEEIYIVRGYLGELFDQLLYKYPMIRFVENPKYAEANNIASALAACQLLSNAYVFEADLLIRNPSIIKKYHYSSDFLAIKKNHTDDWCFEVRNGVITEEKFGGEGDDIWQMVGISYWNKEDGEKLVQDLQDVYSSPCGKECYWEQVPLTFRKKRYAVEVMECHADDVIEIDTFAELKEIDKKYDVQS